VSHAEEEREHMESTENLIRDVLVAALKSYSHDRAVRETLAWLVEHPTEHDIFSLPLVRRAIDNMAVGIELIERGALIQGRLRDRGPDFRRGRG